MFMDRPGLFGWHNPVGALVGGTGEIYGNHESMVAMKLRKNLRLGLVITANNSWTKKLIDPSLAAQYDLILHVTGYILNGESKFLDVYREWVLINPDAVEAFTADPKTTAKHFKIFDTALRTKKSEVIDGKVMSAIETLAGPQHDSLEGYKLDGDRIEKLVKRLESFESRLPAWTKTGWIHVPSACEKTYRSQ
jgi:hypothetical protein